MDAAHIHRRIEVVIVTTRAAVASREPGGGPGGAAVRRGLHLLDGIEADVGQDGDVETLAHLARARRELESMLGEASS